jgi:hypothetical protein
MAVDGLVEAVSAGAAMFATTKVRGRIDSRMRLIAAGVGLTLLVVSLAEVRFPTKVRAEAAATAPLRVATFQADITPPKGAPLCYGWITPATTVDDPLTARGVILLGAGDPIVLCALDWIGVGNTGYSEYRAALAAAARTTPDRVALHCLHQHDAPGCDFATEAHLAAVGASGISFDPRFAREALERIAGAIKDAIPKARAISHLGYGEAPVVGVACNRRILGADGQVAVIRWSASKEAAAISAPEGTIDPLVRNVSLWDGDTPVVSLTYYTTHPQSYYARGGVSCDFPGLARELRELDLPEVAHVHFNGASGNVTAGKYNDGETYMRNELARRLALGMKQAWANTRKTPLTAGDVAWRVVPVHLPPAAHLDNARLKATLANDKATPRDRIFAARHLAWKERCDARVPVELSALWLGGTRLIHMPGELFVEYQLAAKTLAGGPPVCMAAYGEYGCGYIGTQVAYSQGGYETSPGASLVAPEVEGVLIEGMRTLLK